MRVIHVLRKPCSESTVTANVLKHGTGGLNIDASRISTDDNLNGGAYAENPTERWDGAENWRYKRGDQGNAGEYQKPSGRWPANVILQHLDGCRCDGVKRVKASAAASGPSLTGKSTSNSRGVFNGVGSTPCYAGEDGKESVANWICEPGCPVARLDEQSGVSKSAPEGVTFKDTPARSWKNTSTQGIRRVEHGDTGGASRFYKQVGGKTDG